MKDKSLIYLGLLLSFFWFADTFTKIFIYYQPLRTLWFSSAGLGITIIALFTKSSFLITSMISALSAIEGVWIIGFLSKLLFNKALPGVAEYAFRRGYPGWEFVITLYHLFLIPILLFAVFKTKRVHKLGWLGATVFTTIIAFATYFLADNKENINCIYKLDYCQSFLKPLYQFDNPERIFIGILFLTLILFMPINWLILRITNHFARGGGETLSKAEWMP